MAHGWMILCGRSQRLQNKSAGAGGIEVAREVREVDEPAVDARAVEVDKVEEPGVDAKACEVSC